MPWFQGDGAHYLYLAGQDQTQAFGVDYSPPSRRTALAGVTAPVEERQYGPGAVRHGVVRQPGHAELHLVVGVAEHLRLLPASAPTHYSGGATLGAYGAAGLVQSDDVAYAAKQAGVLPDDFVVYRNADATKSWFMLDDEIVVLAAGVGDPAGRAVTTTIDSRIAGAGRRSRRSPEGCGTAALVRHRRRRPGLAALRQHHREARRSATSSSSASRSPSALDRSPAAAASSGRPTRTPL